MHADSPNVPDPACAAQVRAFQQHRAAAEPAVAVVPGAHQQQPGRPATADKPAPRRPRLAHRRPESEPGTGIAADAQQSAASAPTRNTAAATRATAAAPLFQVGDVVDLVINNRDTGEHPVSSKQ